MPSLFTKSFAGTGTSDKYEYVPDGIYVGELISFDEGRPYVDPKDPDAEPEPKVRWSWNLYQLDGTTPVMNAGAQVVISEQTSTKTGPKATAPAWFSSHLKRAWDNRENLEETQDECIGKRVMLNITTKVSGYKKVDVLQGA